MPDFSVIGLSNFPSAVCVHSRFSENPNPQIRFSCRLRNSENWRATTTRFVHPPLCAWELLFLLIARQRLATLFGLRRPYLALDLLVVTSLTFVMLNKPSSAASIFKNVDHSGDLTVKGTFMMIREWLHLSNQEDFVKFCEMSMSLRAWTAYLIFILIFQFPFYFYSYLLDIRFGSNPAAHRVAIFGVLAMLILASLNIIAYIYFFNQKQSIDNAFNRFLKPYISTIRSFLVLGMNAFYGFRLLSRTMIGECDTEKSSFGSSWSCNPQANVDGLPPESVYILMGGQILFVILFRDVRVGVFLLSWLECFIFLAISIQLSHARPYFPTSLVFLFLSFFVVLETARHHISLYMVTLQLRDALKENETMSNQMHATEMRHMIANVAHDLKTPLTSFLSGIELIADVAMDLQKRTGDGRITATYLQDSILSVLNCVNNIRNTNSFMLMTINRCIDYTKASKGLKLVPKHETIDLMETLSLPLNCMKDIQQRVAISLEPIPPNICSHIITDKQWLQENVLCLLSNAVKYSSGGTVTIALYVIPGSHRNSKIKKKPAPGDSPRKISLGSHNTAQVYPSNTPTIDCGDDDMGMSGVLVEDNLEIAPYVWPHDSKDGQESSGEYLRIEIEDTGIGLSEEAMANLFNPFKQAQRLAGGTGLGLYSLARRVEALSGYYGVDHRRDGEQGSMFWFSIPYRPDRITAGSIRRSMFPRRTEGWLSAFIGSRDDERSPPASGANSVCHSAKESVVPAISISPNILPSNMAIAENDEDSMSDNCSIQSVHLDILIVDDSPAIVKMTSMMLKRLGHSITIAENGDAGLKKIWERLDTLKRPFDAVLMDLQMPVMDGLEATRRLRTYELNYMAENLKSSSGSTHASSPSRSLRGRMPKALSDRNECNKLVAESEFSERSPPSSPNRPIASMTLTTRHQFVIGVSANSDHGTMQEALDAGVDAFMSKPFTIETFYDTYERMKSTKHG